MARSLYLVGCLAIPLIACAPPRADDHRPIASTPAPLASASAPKPVPAAKQDPCKNGWCLRFNRCPTGATDPPRCLPVYDCTFFGCTTGVFDAQLIARLEAPPDECVFSRAGIPADAGPWEQQDLLLVSYCPEAGPPDACVPAWHKIGESCWASDDMLDPPRYACRWTDAGCAQAR